MAYVTGVDPGLTGALCTVCSDTRRIVDLIDMPTWNMAVGKKTRKRVDAVALNDYVEMLKLMGVSCIVIEAVGGRPKQSAGAGFVFGYTVGMLYMTCIVHKLIIETVPPGTWKRVMRIPGKKEGVDPDGAIIGRADELFPDDRARWRGKLGGAKLDRAEAALLAQFGIERVLGSVQSFTDYRNADTGA
jgi:hypothetical protein